MWVCLLILQLIATERLLRRHNTNAHGSAYCFLNLQYCYVVAVVVVVETWHLGPSEKGFPS